MTRAQHLMSDSRRGVFDAAAFWRMFRSDRVSLLQALYVKYPLMPPHYVYYFVECLAGIEGNAQIVSYVDADLSALDRGLALMDSIVAAGYRLSGARCLDIGCSNGALLVAAQMRGAGRSLGVDLSEARLVSARKVCVGKPIDLLRIDAATDAIPGTYDVVFCTDVLEHVPEWSRIIDQIRRTLAPGGSAFVFLHNAKQPSSVRWEPHYGVPGLVLLPRTQAAEVWREIHDEVSGVADYDVYEWPSYREIARATGAAGLVCYPWADGRMVMRDRGAFWRGYERRAAELCDDVDAALWRIPPRAAAVLRGAVEAYTCCYIEEHRAFEASHANCSEGAVLDFFMRYYSPTNAVLRWP